MEMEECSKELPLPGDCWDEECNISDICGICYRIGDNLEYDLEADTMVCHRCFEG